MNRFTRLCLKSLPIMPVALPLSALAQETSLSEVVVSSPKIEVPLNTTGIGAADLQQLRPATSDTASLLRNTPGVSLYGAGGVSSLPAIHGLADDRLRTKVDGMDLISACANHMNAPLSYIDPTNVGSVKVFAGITPVSLGGDSIGGTILVNSAEPAFAAPGQGALVKGQAGAFFRSNGNARGANLSATLVGENLSVTYSGSTAESGNYEAAKKFKAGASVTNNKNRDGHWLDGDEVASSYYKSVNQALGIALRHESHLVELKVGVQNVPYQGFPNQRMDMTDNDSTQVNLRYSGQFGWGALEARAYSEKTRHSMNFGRDKQYWYGAIGTIPGMPMETEGNNTGAQVKADIVLSERDILRVGGELRRFRLDDGWPPSGGMMSGMMMDPNTFRNINDGERDRTALFAEWEARWNPRWLTALGARAERVATDAGRVQGYGGMMYVADANAFNARSHGRSDDNLDLTALARYTPDASRSFELGIARKTRSPNLYERYAWSRTGMAMLMVNTASAGFVYLKYANQKARLYGADISGHFPLAKNTAFGSFTLSGMLNLLKGRNLSSDDDLYNIMPTNARLALAQKLGAWTNTVEVQLVSAKSNVSQVRNEMKTDGYGLLNLRSSYEWKQARFDFGIENLLDKFYSHPLGGAYVGQGRTMLGTGVPWGVTVPGMGRSFYAGLSVKF